MHRPCPGGTSCACACGCGSGFVAVGNLIFDCKCSVRANLLLGSSTQCLVTTDSWLHAIAPLIYDWSPGHRLGTKQANGATQMHTFAACYLSNWVDTCQTHLDLPCPQKVQRPITSVVSGVELSKSQIRNLVSKSPPAGRARKASARLMISSQAIAGPAPSKPISSPLAFLQPGRTRLRARATSTSLQRRSMQRPW